MSDCPLGKKVIYSVCSCFVHSAAAKCMSCKRQQQYLYPYSIEQVFGCMEHLETLALVREAH